MIGGLTVNAFHWRILVMLCVQVLLWLRYWNNDSFLKLNVEAGRGRSIRKYIAFVDRVQKFWRPAAILLCYSQWLMSLILDMLSKGTHTHTNFVNLSRNICVLTLIRWIQRKCNKESSIEDGKAFVKKKKIDVNVFALRAWIGRLRLDYEFNAVDLGGLTYHMYLFVYMCASCRCAPTLAVIH